MFQHSNLPVTASEAYCCNYVWRGEGPAEAGQGPRTSSGTHRGHRLQLLQASVVAMSTTGRLAASTGQRIAARHRQTRSHQPGTRVSASQREHSQLELIEALKHPSRIVLPPREYNEVSVYSQSTKLLYFTVVTSASNCSNMPSNFST